MYFFSKTSFLIELPKLVASIQKRSNLLVLLDIRNFGADALRTSQKSFLLIQF